MLRVYPLATPPTPLHSEATLPESLTNRLFALLGRLDLALLDQDLPQLLPLAKRTTDTNVSSSVKESPTTSQLLSLTYVSESLETSKIQSSSAPSEFQSSSEPSTSLPLKTTEMSSNSSSSLVSPPQSFSDTLLLVLSDSLLLPTILLSSQVLSGVSSISSPSTLSPSLEHSLSLLPSHSLSISSPLSSSSIGRLSSLSSSSLMFMSNLASLTGISSASSSSLSSPSSIFSISSSFQSELASSSYLEGPTTSRGPSSSWHSYYSTIISPDTTITTFITVPTAAETSNNDNRSSNGTQTGKLVGGIVGAIGGCLIIGVFAFLFLLRRRREKITNQLPDFADDNLGQYKEKFGFKKLFGAKFAPPSGTRGISSFADLEDQLNMKSAALAGLASIQYGSHDTDGDFEYRGVSNSNNLNSVLRSGTNTSLNSGGVNSSSASVRLKHSRYNSAIGPPMETMTESEQGQEDVFGFCTDNTLELSEDRSSDFDFDEIFRSEHRAIFPKGDYHSNNSKLRFTEEI